jgi:hypothetical protein
LIVAELRNGVLVVHLGGLPSGIDVDATVRLTAAIVDVMVATVALSVLLHGVTRRRGGSRVRVVGRDRKGPSLTGA